MITLDNVTIIAVAGTKAEETIKAINYSCREIKFGAKKIITPSKINDDSIEVIECEPLDYEQYNHFIVYRLHEYINTKYALIVQNDGYVVNPDTWEEEFLKYDYIGAPWPLPHDDFSFRDPEGNIQRVGNGGFSLRKRSIMLKVLDRLGQSPTEYEDQYYSIGCGIIKANVPTRDIATGFSIEQIYTPKSFAIHKAWLHIPHKVKELCEDCEGLETLISLQSVCN